MLLKVETIPHVLIVGAPKVGKSALLQSFTNDTSAEKPATESKSSPSKFRTVKTKVDGRDVTLKITDDKTVIDLDPKTKLVQKKVNVAILVYDVTKPESVDTLQQDYDLIKNCVPDCKFVLLGNKSDQVHATVLPKDTSSKVDAFCIKNAITLQGTASAQTGAFVQDALHVAVRACAKKPAASHANSSTPGRLSEETKKELQNRLSPQPQSSSTGSPVVTPIATPPATPKKVAEATPEEGSTSTPLIPPAEDSSATAEEKSVPIQRPKVKRSCSTLFWQVMKSPVMTTLGGVLLLAGVAAIVAGTYGIGGAAIAGILTMAGASAAGFGGVSFSLSMYSIFGRKNSSHSETPPEPGKVPAAPLPPV